MQLRSLVLLASCLASCLALVGCGDPPPPPRFPVTFTAVSDPGVPLAGVTVTANGAPIPGQTGGDGVLRVFLTGPEGSPVQIGAHCPEGHRAADDLPMITLRQVVGLDPAARDRGLEVGVRCPPLQRHGIIVVRAGGEQPQANVPVMIDGREVARTDTSGIAHVALDMQPGSTFQVLLATASMPTLRPQDPRLSFTFPDDDEVFVFDQSFDVEAPPPVRRGRRRAVVAPTIQRTGPVRIGGPPRR